MVHHVYVGHFVPEDGFVRCVEGCRLFADRPINMATVIILLRKYLEAAATLADLPVDWGMSILADHIVCYLTGPAVPLEFAADYAEQEKATIVDMGSFSLITPQQLRELAALDLRQQPQQHGTLKMPSQRKADTHGIQPDPIPVTDPPRQ